MPENTGNREIHLKSRPKGMPTEDHFRLVETPVPQPESGEVLVRNIFMSVDPYMRARMREGKSYVEPFQVGQPLDGGCVGQVVRSENGPLEVGAYVLGAKGWREYYVSDGSDLTRIDPGVAPIQAFLGVVGMTGMTGYTGLLKFGRPAEGDTVFVSAAAGAVGSVVCQVAKIKGCRVIASAGSEEKLEWLKSEAGVDETLHYKQTDDLTAELKRKSPDGIDIYYENVGGDHLEAALANMNDAGRVVMCGLISQYNAEESPCGPGNLFNVITKRLTMQGFIVSDHMDEYDAFLSDMAEWIQAGEIRWKETVVEGIEKAPEAFIGLFHGENFGKMLVRVGPDPAV